MRIKGAAYQTRKVSSKYHYQTRILVKRFDEFLEKIDSFLPKERFYLSLSKITRILSLIGLTIVFSMMLTYEIAKEARTTQGWEIITIILIIFVVNMTSMIIRSKYNKSKVIQNIQELRTYILKESKLTNKIVSTSDLITSNSDYVGNFYSKYEDCFVQTLRDGEWVKIPKNLLVEGDYIKINVGEAACADVSCVDYRYAEIAKEKKWDFCLKKNEIFNGFENSLDESNIGPYRSKYDNM